MNKCRLSGGKVGVACTHQGSARVSACKLVNVHFGIAVVMNRPAQVELEDNTINAKLLSAFSLQKLDRFFKKVSPEHARCRDRIDCLQRRVVTLSSSGVTTQKRTFLCGAPFLARRGVLLIRDPGTALMRGGAKCSGSALFGSRVCSAPRATKRACCAAPGTTVPIEPRRD